jgi:hypothetical protein
MGSGASAAYMHGDSGRPKLPLHVTFLDGDEPLSVKIPEDNHVSRIHGTSPVIWTNDHAALLKGTPPPPGISLRAFEPWYRERLMRADASSAWSPSQAKGYTAMIDLWIRISTNRKPSPAASPSTPLAGVPPDVSID